MTLPVADEDSIHQVISSALLSARLPPGAPLREVALAAVFGVSRERIRKVLLRLGTERLLELIPNRGAFVAAPGLEQAREIYEARRVLEGGVVGHLASRLGEADARALDQHLRKEEAAAAAGNRPEAIRLSGEFHQLLAQATGSAFIQQALQQLVSRTSMLVALFEPAQSMRCACEEHRAIFSALSAGDGPAAMKAMQQHLALIETRLRPAREVASGDTTDLLRQEWQAWRRRQRPAATRPKPAPTPPRRAAPATSARSPRKPR